MVIHSAFDPSFLWLPPVGMGIGLLVTMFGGGGGFFYVPILTLLFHIPTQAAVTTSLVSTIPTGVVGAIEHHRKGNIHFRIGLLFGIAGLAGALIGTYVSSLVSSASLQKLFGVYALLLTIPMILSSRKRFRKTEDQEKTIDPLTKGKIFLGIFFGILSGLMAGLFGTSGTATIVAGLYILDLPVTAVVGTSVLIVLFNAISGSIGHMIAGQIDVEPVLLLGSGAMIGAFLGPRILAKIDIQTLEKAYGVLFTLLVVGFGIAMILK